MFRRLLLRQPADRRGCGWRRALDAGRWWVFIACTTLGEEHVIRYKSRQSIVENFILKISFFALSCAIFGIPLHSDLRQYLLTTFFSLLPGSGSP